MNYIEIEEIIKKKLPDRVTIYSTIFYTAKSESSFFQILGSGTFISSNGKKLILTASHVIDELEKQEAIGISIGNSAQFYGMEKTCLNFTRLKKEPYNENGPDLGIVCLPDIFADDILAKNKVFYNIDLHLQNDKIDKYPTEIGSWAIVGFPVECKKECMENNISVTNAIGQINLVLSPTLSIKKSFDLMTFELPGCESYKGIESYGGMSGGGIWHIIISEKNGNIEIKKVIFKGVVVFQQKDRGSSRLVVAHGPNSTYDFIQGYAKA